VWRQSADAVARTVAGAAPQPPLDPLLLGAVVDLWLMDGRSGKELAEACCCVPGNAG